MANNPDITKYFGDSAKKSILNQIGFKQLSKQEENTDLLVNSTEEPPVCKLFQNANSESGSFFDMIGSSSTNLSLGLERGKEGIKSFENCTAYSPFDALPLPKSGRINDGERSRDAWIPSEATRRVLITMVTSPPGVYTPDRETLTMPGVVLEEDMKDPVTEAVFHYLGPIEAAKRKVLSSSDVTQDDRGLRELIEAGCYRAAVNLTRPLLTIYGQGAGKAGHPSKHTVHSIQLWFTRLALLVKLRSFMLADVESEPFGDLDMPDLFFQFNPELNGGRLGSMVPFGFRLLVAQIPMYIEKHQLCLTRLHKILATVRKILSNLEKGLLEDGTPCDTTKSNREEAFAIWRKRETLVLHHIINCAISFKDYTLAIEVMEVILSKGLPDEEVVKLQSALGRILLQSGDVIAAEKQFQKVRERCNPATNVRCLVDIGLLHVAENQFKDALVSFEKANNLDPSNVMIISNMAVCLLYLGRLKEAVTLLENGLQSYPELAFHESYLLNLCNLYELQSTHCLNAKLNLLSLVSQYRGDNANIACLKLT